MTDEFIRLGQPFFDEFRAPYVWPIGALVMSVTKLEHAIIELCACTYCSGPEVDHISFRAPGKPSAIEEAAERLKNWDKKKIAKHLDQVPRPMRTEARRILRAVEKLRAKRNRVVHDVVDVGVQFLGPGRRMREVRAVTMLAGYPRLEKQATRLTITGTSPEGILQLAREAQELYGEVDTLTFRIRSNLRSRRPSMKYMGPEQLKSLAALRSPDEAGD